LDGIRPWDPWLPDPAEHSGIYEGDAWRLEMHVTDPSRARMQRIMNRYSRPRGVQIGQEQIEELSAAKA
jgi:hypothetical protein